MGKLHDLASCGQSVWFDYIQRSLISGGELGRLIEEGIRGVTSNPTIFEKAIAGSTDYDLALASLAREGKDTPAIYEELVLKDIALAADLFLPVYTETRGLDGYVSVEVPPALAFDAPSTVEEASRIFSKLARPNVMIKVPATEQGVEAVVDLVERGVNVNVTLIFSVERYEQVARAYMTGLTRRLDAGKPVKGVASVASFFVSRIDTAVDRELAARGIDGLSGKAAIACAKAVYARFKELFSGKPWEALAGHGAAVQRPLWASTGTKNPRYPDTMYVDTLIGPHTVNTLPPATLGAFLDHGTVIPSIERGLDEAFAVLDKLSASKIDLCTITDGLEKDGLEAFGRSFDALLKSIESKRCEVMTP